LVQIGTYRVGLFAGSTLSHCGQRGALLFSTLKQKLDYRSQELACSQGSSQ
jgi:hypothetical protein